MEALLVVDVQNEFSPRGRRPVPNYSDALQRIVALAVEARADKRPIAWIQHHNRPEESPAFTPGTWGAELSSGLGPKEGFGPEKLFQKDVYGAFTGTDLESWLRNVKATELMIAGFYTHMCVSTTAREALVRGFRVIIDPAATGARALKDDALGKQTADDVRRAALLHLQNMGVAICKRREQAVN